jgi:CubicO group peptidase (beta-lactamase class C family)
MRWIWICLIWVLSALPLAAQDQATVQRMTLAFETWMQSNDASKGSLAIWFKGKPVYTHEIGISANAPMEMASLSKAVTGVCTAQLVKEGRLAYSDKVPLIDGLRGDITIADLLRQTSGLKIDGTQDTMPQWFGQRAHRAVDVRDAIIARGGPSKKANRFRYNNENYALLGLAIKAASGQSYETACQSRVFKPAGVTAAPSPQTGAFLSWGGWHMSVDDYARFINFWFGPASEIGKDPFKHPHVELEGGANYGNGMFFRSFRSSFNFWHHGGLCFRDRLSVGSYAVSWMGEWSAVAAYDICPDWRAMGDIDKALSKAVFQ